MYDAAGEGNDTTPLKSIAVSRNTFIFIFREILQWNTQQEKCEWEEFG